MSGNYLVGIREMVITPVFGLPHHYATYTIVSNYLRLQPEYWFGKASEQHYRKAQNLDLCLVSL